MSWQVGGTAATANVHGEGVRPSEGVLVFLSTMMSAPLLSFGR